MTAESSATIIHSQCQSGRNPRASRNGTSATSETASTTKFTDATLRGTRGRGKLTLRTRLAFARNESTE